MKRALLVALLGVFLFNTAVADTLERERESFKESLTKEVNRFIDTFMELKKRHFCLNVSLHELKRYEKRKDYEGESEGDWNYLNFLVKKRLGEMR